MLGLPNIFSESRDLCSPCLNHLKKHFGRHGHLSDIVGGLFYLEMDLRLTLTHQQHFTVFFNLSLPFISAETQYNSQQYNSKAQWAKVCGDSCFSVHYTQYRRDTVG